MQNSREKTTTRKSGGGRYARRGLLYSSILTSCLLFVNGTTVTRTYAAACVGGVDGANGTVCFVGSTADTLTYVGSNPGYAGGNFSLTLQNHDVTGTTDGITFNGVTGGDGFINLTGDSNVRGDAGHGISSAGIDSNTEIIIEDTSTVSGAFSGILALSVGASSGNITITTDSGTSVTGDNGHGIFAGASEAGNIVVNAQGVVTGTGGHGIVVYATTGTVEVTTGAAAVTGTAGSGIDAFGETGATVDTHGNVTGVGAGISAVANNGNVLVTTAGAAGTLVSGTGGNGIYAEAFTTGNVVVDAQTAVAGAVNGIDANATAGTVSVTTGAGFAITGNNGNGIDATASGQVTVSTGGNVTGTGGIGINAVSITNGNVNVTTNGVAGTLISGTNGGGIVANAAGTGNTDVEVHTHVTGSTIGIDANATSGSVEVTTDQNIVNGLSGHGIDATASGLVTVSTGGDVIGTGGNGINAVSSANGNVNVTTNGAAGTVISGSNGGAGIFADAAGTGNTDVEVHTNVAGSIGIDANATNGTVEVTTDQYTVTGQSGHGIDATASGLVRVSTGGNVTGTGGIGINAVSSTNGDVYVTTSGGAGLLIRGMGGAGIFADAAGTGSTDVEVHTAVTGSTIGIDANATSGTVEVTTDQYAVTGLFGAGIDATASGNVTVGTGGNVTGNGIGINAVSSTNGNVNVTTNGISPIRGMAGAGIFADAAGTGNTDVEVHTAVLGSTIGIDANATSGTVEVTTDQYAVHGLAGDGILARASGNVTVETNGSVTGVVGNGINAQSFAGGDVVVTTDDLSGDANVLGSGAGINASTTDAGTITITNNVSVAGSVAGVWATSGGGAIQITNDFLIANLSLNGGPSLADSDLAIRTLGGPTTIDNNLLLIGRVITDAGADHLINDHFWVTEGTSDFAGGADVVDNNKLIYAGDEKDIAEETTFANLETLNNNGVDGIVLQDQKAGDGSNISDRLITSGNYNGNGGNLWIDAFLGGPGSVADVLEIGGNATGVTEIFVTDTNVGPGGYDPDGILVARVSGTSAADTFALADGPIDKGLFFYDLLFDQPNGEYLLFGLPDREVFETLAAVSSSQEIWRETADAWSTRQENLRDVMATRQVVTGVADVGVVADNAPIGTLWASALGSWTDRDDDASFSVLNASFDFDMSYKQNIYGVVGGADFFADMGGDTSLLFGLMGGYVDSKLNYDESSTSIDTSGGTVGGYAALLSNGFFATVLVKADLLNMDYTAGSLAEDDNDSADVTSWGVRGDMGYRFGDTLFVEPMLSIDGISTKIDEFSIGGVDIDAGTNESFRGGAGVRAGYGDETFRASATARIWDVFSTENEVKILADVPLGINDSDLEGVYGDFSGQVDVNLASNATIYLKGGILFNDDVTKPNASGGFAYYW